MINIKAHAKINLSLDVTGRRPDGYHLVDMLMQEISLHDDVYISKNESGSVILGRGFGKDAPPRSENLMYKAAVLMKETFGIKEGVSLGLESRIPFMAGLGGGSSDAAAVLKGMDRLFNINAGHGVLSGLAGKLGCDVPFFIRGGLQRAEGIGTSLTKLKSPAGLPEGLAFPKYVLLAKPLKGEATPHIYASYDSAFKTLGKAVARPDVSEQVKALDGMFLLDPAEPLAESKFRKHIHDFLKNNLDVLEYALSDRTLTNALKSDMINLGAESASMTGSGSAVYGLFKSREAAVSAGGRLKEKPYRAQLQDVLTAEFL